MQQAERDNLQDVFWDMYKDAHGIRPRFVDTSAWTAEDFEKEFTYLQGIITRDLADQAVRQEQASRDFEKRVEETIALGAWTRDNAIRWIHDAEDTNGDDEYLCYTLGLKYGYKLRIAPAVA
jgi:hypothetical protein